MKIVLLAVGRLRNAALRTLCAEFLGRLQHFGAVEVREVKAADAEVPEQVAAQEGACLLASVESGSEVLVLDERGAQMTSVELSQFLQALELRGTGRLVVILGGAYGLSAEVRKRGKLLSLSRMTLPHELCRAVVLEQLYRARTIQNNQPYHHA